MRRCVDQNYGWTAAGSCTGRSVHRSIYIGQQATTAPTVNGRILIGLPGIRFVPKWAARKIY